MASREEDKQAERESEQGQGPGATNEVKLSHTQVEGSESKNG